MLGALALLLPGCSREPRVVSLGRPPVVLIVLDALHAGRVSHLGYGRETTPHLDALAAEGVSLSRAFAPAPYTVASIPSLLTGRLPDSHGVTSPVARLADEETTLAEALGAAGYRTVGAVANMNGGARLGNDQGFDRFDELFRSPDGEPVAGGQEESDLFLAPANLFVDFTREVLERDVGDRPLFLYLHVLEPHAPYSMPSSYRQLWLEPEYDGMFASGETAAFISTLSGKLEPTERDIAAATALYDGNLRWADHNLGEIRALLEQAGIWEQALVIVTSDHGEAFWEHGRWGHNDHLFDEQLRVPLVIKLPAGRGSRGVVRDELVSIIDVCPSILQWLDLPAGELPVDGTPLAAMVENEAWRPAERELLLRSHHEIAHLGLRTATEKTIVERVARPEGDGRTGRLGRTTRIHFYSLSDDPGEHDDLYELERGRADRNARRLEEWGRRTTLERNQGGTVMTPSELHMLKNLGYIDSVPPMLSFEERRQLLIDLGFDEVADVIDASMTNEEIRVIVNRVKAERAGGSSATDG